MAVQRKANFTVAEANAASAAWGFNCGPGALCAVTGMKPEQLRPHLLDFEQKGYTNPTLMFDVLKKLGIPHRQTYRSDALPTVEETIQLSKINFGLVRVQWDGPWCKPGVPMRARYRQTHWIVVAGEEVFDVNAVTDQVQGWITRRSWSVALVPWLLEACVPKATGGFWFTHVIEVEPKEAKL